MLITPLHMRHDLHRRCRTGGGNQARPFVFHRQYGREHAGVPLRAFAHWVRVLVVSVLAAMLPGCAENDAFDQHVLRMDRSVETVRNALILTNIVRASFNAPLTFISVPTVRGSTMVGGTAGLPTLTFGSNQEGEYAFGPNSLTASGTTSFDVVTLDSNNFYRGLLTPLSLETLHFFVQQGFQRDILFHLAIDRVVVGHGTSRKELRNDPRYPSFREFLERLQSAIELGLTTETVGGDKKAVGFCFDPSLASRRIDGARPVCGTDRTAGLSLGDERAFGKTPEGLEVNLRSTQGIFYALGHMVNAPPDQQIIVPDPSRRSAGEIIFHVDKGAPTGPCLARADYNEQTYCIPLGTARNSALALGLLAQLLALNTSINDLPLTSTVRLTP